MRLTLVVLLASCVSGCTTDSTEEQCTLATMKHAEATERFVAATNKSVRDAWLEAHLASKRWKDKVCH
jgi:hypothetical protein